MGDCDTSRDTMCATNFAKCTGTGFKSALRCCNPEHVCIRKNVWYGQCRNANFAAQEREGWSGEFVHCNVVGGEDTETWFSVNNVTVGNITAGNSIPVGEESSQEPI